MSNAPGRVSASSARGALHPLVPAVAAAGIGCLDPTQVLLEVKTADVTCKEVDTTSITVGKLREIEEKPPVITTDRCDADRRWIGSTMLVPSGAKDELVAVRVITGVDGTKADYCDEKDDPDVSGDLPATCIVARRAVKYLPHTELRLRVELEEACKGVDCGPEETCIQGDCVPARIQNPEDCIGKRICVPKGPDASVEPDGGGDATAPMDHRSDSVAAEGGPDTSLEAADGPTDAPATTDGPVEAPADAPADRTPDAVADGRPDASQDASGDAPIDAPAEAPPDSPPDILAVDGAGPPVGFARTYGASGGPDAFTALWLAGDGTVAATGTYVGTGTTFGGAPLPDANSPDIVVASYDATGAERWSRGFGSVEIAGDEGRGVATDSKNDVWVTGLFSGTISFDGGTTNLPFAGPTSKSDAFLAKLDGVTGGHLASTGFGAVAVADEGLAVATDASDNVYVAGRYAGPIVIKDAHGTIGGSDFFVAKFDPAATPVWSKGLGSAGADEADAIAVSGSTVYAGGSIGGDTDFGAGVVPAPGGSSDMFVVAYGTDGSLLWSSVFGSAGNERVRGIAARAGRVFVTGVIGGLVDFGPAGSAAPNGTQDVFVASLDATTGVAQWVRSFGGASAVDVDTGRAISTDSAANVYVAGAASGTFDVGSTPRTSNGFDDVVVASYTSGGTPRYLNAWGGTSFDYGQAIATDGAGRVYLGGLLQSVNVSFGASQVGNDAAGDAFLVVLGP